MALKLKKILLFLGVVALAGVPVRAEEIPSQQLPI